MSPSWDTCLLRFTWGTEHTLWCLLPLPEMPGTSSAPLEPLRTHKEEIRQGSAPWEFIPRVSPSCNPKPKDVAQTLTCMRSSTTICLWLMCFPLLSKEGAPQSPIFCLKLFPNPSLQPGPFLHCRQSRVKPTQKWL